MELPAPSQSDDLTRPIAYLVVAFTSISLYNALELILLILLTFRTYRSLYFWSLIVATFFGVIPYAIGNVLLRFNSQLGVNLYGALFLCGPLGWYCMVTGQAVVLYSRLHLVCHNQTILKAILAMIITNAILFHIPTTVLTYGSGGNPRPPPEEVNAWSRGYTVMEKVQMTMFCLQEFIISGVYLKECLRVLKDSGENLALSRVNSTNAEERLNTDGRKNSVGLPKLTRLETSSTFRQKFGIHIRAKRRSSHATRRNRRLIYELIGINIFIILMDLVLLGIEYASLYTLETTFKGVVYSVKLRLEFAVLSQLVRVSKLGKEQMSDDCQAFRSSDQSQSGDEVEVRGFGTGLTKFNTVDRRALAKENSGSGIDGGNTDEEEWSGNPGGGKTAVEIMQELGMTRNGGGRREEAEGDDDDDDESGNGDIDHAIDVNHAGAQQQMSDTREGPLGCGPQRKLDAWAQNYAYR